MKPLSLEPVFLPATADTSNIRARLKKVRAPEDSISSLLGTDFDTAYDTLRTTAAAGTAADETAQVTSTLAEMDSVLSAAGSEGENDSQRIILHAAILQILTALHIEQNSLDDAAVTAARALSLLARDPKRKDTPFLQVLGCLLYDISHLHGERGEFKQAEREVEKSIKVFERLADTRRLT